MTAADAGLALLVFLSSMCIDFANTRYVAAVVAVAPHRAGRWSAMQWACSLVGFVVALKYTLWMLPIEMLGLYTGTVVSLTLQVRSRERNSAAS